MHGFGIAHFEVEGQFTHLHLTRVHFQYQCESIRKLYAIPKLCKFFYFFMKNFYAFSQFTLFRRNSMVVQ